MLLDGREAIVNSQYGVFSIVREDKERASDSFSFSAGHCIGEQMSQCHFGRCLVIACNISCTNNHYRRILMIMNQSSRSAMSRTTWNSCKIEQLNCKFLILASRSSFNSMQKCSLWMKEHRIDDWTKKTDNKKRQLREITFRLWSLRN